MENPIKCFNIEAFGSYHRIFVDHSVDSQYIQETLNIAKVAVFQFSYTEYLITDNWLIYMESYLNDKGLFKFQLKKLFKESQKSLRSIIKIVEQNSEPDYCNEYANQLYDMCIPTLKKLRDLIAQKLTNLNVDKPGLCATVIVLQNLICMSTDTFEHIFKRIKEQQHIDVKNCFTATFPAQALKSIEKMLTLVMGEGRYVYEKNVVNNKSIKDTFDKFARILYDPKNIQIASRAAYEAMSDEQKERYILLEDGACVLKEYVADATKTKDSCKAS